MSLDTCRNNIDAIDAEILSLLARRIAVVREIAAIKCRHSLPVADPVREAEILARLEPVKDEPNKAIVRVYEEIINQSRQIQINEMAKNSRQKLNGRSSRTLAHRNNTEMENVRR